MSSANQTYSQSGEDVIIDFIFDTLKIKSLRYLDIGAHDPVRLNNTYLFYKKGHRGVCVEPEPSLAKAFVMKRPEDRMVQAGVGTTEETQKFYLMEPSTLNTFSKKEAEIYQKYYPWTNVRRIIEVPMVNIDTIFREYFSEGIDLLSVDAEGMDKEILESIDFKKYRPLAICVETAVYSGSKVLKKNNKLIQLVRENGYFIYADTFVNTIFVDYKAWRKHGGPSLEGF